MELLEQKRQEIIFLYIYRRELRLSLRAIVKELKYSRDIVKIWIKKYKETENIQDKKGRGRKRKTSEKKDLDIVTITKKNRTKILAEIFISMDKQGTALSIATVSRRLNEQGLYKL